MTWWRPCWEAPAQYQADRLTFSQTLLWCLTCFQNISLWGRLTFWVENASMRDYLIILQMGQLRAMCADLFWDWLNFWPPWTIEPPTSQKTQSLTPSDPQLILYIRCSQSLYSYQSTDNHNGKNITTFKFKAPLVTQFLAWVDLLQPYQISEI